MRIEVQKKDGVCILRMAGKVTVGEPSILLGKTFKTLVADGERRFLLDMMKVPWLDSGGIGEVVACHKRIKDKEGVVKVAMKGRAHDLFTFYELTRLLDVYEDPDAALAAFRD